MDKITGLIFSKDRAMQLDAALSSLFLHCRDIRVLHCQVLYTVSDSFPEGQYHRLTKEYNSVEFIRETDFRNQVLSDLESYEYVLFSVDDTIFVRDFSLQNITQMLQNNPDALGFSLRLGTNTTYSYPRDISQELPVFTEIDINTLKYDWTTAQGDFGYPLEISSSVYRVNDIFPLLRQIDFTNPNTLEGQMAANRHLFGDKENCLMCGNRSIAFCNPVNIVQDVCRNRAGNNPRYSIAELSRMFEQGYRIDVEKYAGFVPNACHQEVELQFKKLEVSS